MAGAQSIEFGDRLALCRSIAGKGHVGRCVDLSASAVRSGRCSESHPGLELIRWEPARPVLRHDKADRAHVDR